MRAILVWLCLVLALSTSPIRAYGAANEGEKISPEVAAELTAFGETLAQFLRFWSPKKQVSAADPTCKDLEGKVWLGEFDEHSPIPQQLQDYIEKKYREEGGILWEYAKPCPGIDPANERIAVIAGELAKAAAIYAYALGEDSGQPSAVCAPGERGKGCEFKFLDEPSKGLRTSKHKTLRLKPDLTHCDLRNSRNFLGVSCLNDQTTLVDLATFWHQAVNSSTDARAFPSDEVMPDDAKRDALFRVDSVRRLKSFQRALLPYSRWIDSKSLIGELSSLDIYACADLAAPGIDNDTKTCLSQARLPASVDALLEGEGEKLVTLPTREVCRNVSNPKDPNFIPCGVNRDFFIALGTAHLTGFFANKLLVAQKDASMQSNADRTQVLQLAVSVARLSTTARSWLELDDAKVGSFLAANSAFKDALEVGGSLKKQLNSSLEVKNERYTDKDDPCTGVFDYDPNSPRPPPSDQAYDNCNDWLTDSINHLGEEIAFLHAILVKQKAQYDTARAMLSGAKRASVNTNGEQYRNFGEQVAAELYLKTRAAETADTLYKRLGSPTDCKPGLLKDTACKLVLPASKRTPPPDAMRLAARVFPAEDYDSTYNVSTRQLVKVRLTSDGCGAFSAPCYVAESRTPAAVSFIRGTESEKKITSFEYHDWELKVINVLAQQTGPARCNLQDIRERPGDSQDDEGLCRAGHSPMLLNDVQHWVWQRPDDPERPRKWLGYLGANSFVSVDGIGVAWNPDKKELEMFGTFTATSLGSSAFESFRLSLTHDTETDWRRTIRQKSLHAVLKALPALSDVYQRSNSTPSSLNLPHGMEFVGLSLDSVEPLRLRLYANPEGHPALITAFTGSPDRAGKLNWREPRALLTAQLLLAAHDADFEAIGKLATAFTRSVNGGVDRSKTQLNFLGDTLARRDLFEASFLDLAATLTDSRQTKSKVQLIPVNVQATVDRYQRYAQALEENSVVKVLGAWQQVLENHRAEIGLNTLRVDLETRLKGKLIASAVPLTGLDDKAKKELLWLFRFSRWEDADEYIKGQLGALAMEALQAFSASGGLYECWAAHRETSSGSEAGREAICAAPQEALNRIGTQIAKRFVLGSQLHAGKYDKDVEEFRDRLNESPSSLTAQQLLDAAQAIRLKVIKDVEQSLNAAWSGLVADIASDSRDVLASLATALDDKAKSGDLLAVLADLQVNCEEAPLGCEHIFVSLATTSLYGDPGAALTSGLGTRLQRTLEALIPRPNVVYGAAVEAMSDSSQSLAETLEDARSALATVVQGAERESARTVGNGVATFGLVVRESNAFVPPVEVREGALYLRLDGPAWGGKEGDKILGVNCRSDGSNCIANFDNLMTAEDLRAALSPDSLNSVEPSPFMRIQRAGSELTLTLPQTASYRMGIIPGISGLAPAQIAGVTQLLDNVDPRDEAALQDGIQRAEIKHVVLAATIGRLNQAVPFDWDTAYQGELNAFEKACKAATKAYFLFGESACEDPVALFRKATNLNLRQISAELIENIARGVTPLPRPTCTPNNEVHDILHASAKAACDELAAQIGDIEGRLKLSNPSAARAQVAALPQAVTQAFGDAFSRAAQDDVLKTVINVASAADLLPLQQTAFQYKAQAERVCAEALGSLGGADSPGCGVLKQRYIEALNLDLRKIANDQVRPALNQSCVQASQAVGIGDVNNCNDLKARSKQVSANEVKTFLAQFKLVRPDCAPRDNVGPVLNNAAQAACTTLTAQLNAIESAVHDTHLQRAENLTADLPRVVTEAFGDSLKQQAQTAIDAAVDEAHKAGKAVTDQALDAASPYWKEVQQFEQQTNRLCVSMHERAADILGDELPAVEGCKGIDAMVAPEVIKDLMEKRRRDLEQAARDRVETELRAQGKPLIDAAQAAYDEQKKLLRDAAEAQAAPVLAELREAEARLCRGIDKLFNGNNTKQLEVITDAPFIIHRPGNFGAQCVPEKMSLDLKAEIKLLGKTIEVNGGLSLNMDRLREDTFLEQLEAGNFDPASLVDLNWRKFQTNPSLESVLTEELRTKGLTLQRLVARDDKIQVSLQYQPAAFPFAVPVNTEISAKGVQIKLGDLSEVLYPAICREISDYILREQPEILPDAPIVGAPPGYCERRKLKGLELQVAVDLAEGIGTVDIQVFIDTDTGIRIIPPDFKQLAAAQLLSLFGIDAVRPVAPFYDSTDGLTLYLEGKVDMPIGLSLQAGFSVSPRRLKFRGPIGMRIPGWYDASVVSLGNLGITYNPEIKEVSLLGALTVAPGEAMNHLVRVDGRGSLGLKEQKLEVTGNLVVLRLLGVAGSRTTITLPERLFEHTIGTSPMLADIVKLQGQLRIQDLKPNPFLAASGEGGLFGADIATMEVELQRNFGGHFDAGLKIPLDDDSSVAFNVVVEEGMRDVTAGATTELPVGPFKPSFRMDAGKLSVGVGMKVDLEEIGSLDIAFALPSFASLTPEYVLSLLMDMGLTFNVPSSLATIANDAPESSSGSKDGSGGQSQGRKADNARPEDPPKPPGHYARAWRMVPVEYCKPVKLIFKLWCEPRIRWEPAFVEGRGGSMAQQAGYSPSTAEHYDVHYDTTSIDDYDLLVGTGNKDKRAYVFAKDGGLLWSGRYIADHLGVLNSKPYAHKSRNGKNLLVVSTGGDYYGIIPEGGVLDNTDEKNRLKGAKDWLQGNNASGFARRLLPSVAEEQLYNRRMVEQKPIGQPDKWVLLAITKEGDSSPTSHVLAQTRGPAKPLTILGLSDLNTPVANTVSNKTTENLTRHLTALQSRLPDKLDEVCSPRTPKKDTESSLNAPCAYLAIGELNADSPVALGLDDTRSDRPIVLMATTRSNPWLAPVHLPRHFAAASLMNVNPTMLLNLVGSLAKKPDQLDGMEDLTSVVLDLSANGRIAVVGTQGTQEIILFSARNIQTDQKNSAPQYFVPRRLKLACVEEFWAGKGRRHLPSEESLRAEGVTEKDAWIFALIHHDAFKRYGFAADPVGSLYKQDCN